MKEKRSKISPYVFPGLPKIEKQSQLDRLMAIVVNTTGVSDAEIKGKSRARETVRARHLFFHFAREMPFSLRQIGVMAGGRDHSTVIHGSDSIKRLCECKDKYIAGMFAKIKQML